MVEPTEFQIPCAAIHSVARKRPGAVSTGDRALARLDPGLMQLLETEILGTEHSLGFGYHSRYTVPFGLAATAAYAVIAPAQAGGVFWTGFDVSLTWEGPAATEDVLLAEATLTALDPGLACFAISCRTARGNHLLSGVLRLRAVRDGKPLVTSLLTPAPRLPGERPRLPGYRLIASVNAPSQFPLGAQRTIVVEVFNGESTPQSITVALKLPPGAGLSLDGGADPIQVSVQPQSSATVKWILRADRPDEVNLGRPWPAAITAKSGSTEESYTFRIAVPDPRPRRVFYILSEDCETFDGGPLTGAYGAASVLGNANNFMDPEDYRIQMIVKPDRMNEIAERYGARWTHFWCVPQRFAADWACTRSTTGEWPRIAAEMDRSIRRGSAVHEYAPHIHFDYEPDSRHPPQPRLIYDPATDGILPSDYYDPVTNPRHRYHDWDGSSRGISYVKQLGDLSDTDSKAGSLRKCLAYLARMQINRRFPMVARTGGFDFGVTAEDQSVSTAAYAANGLRGNSDARFVDGLPPRSRLSYWCEPQDRMREVENLNGARLVQFAVTRETDFTDAAADNQWFAAAMEPASGPGVHLITVLTHAMFMRGTPDPFRGLDGGSFSGLNDHLRWVKNEYPQVEFATASEALLEFIDYYTPKLEASVAAVLCGGDPAQGIYEYGVRLLGQGIRVDDRHPAAVAILAPPAFEPGDIERLRVIADRELLAEEDNFTDAGRPAVTVVMTNRPADLRVQVLLKRAATARVATLFDNITFTDPVEPVRAPLFRMRFGSTDLLRLLASPIAGNAEPLGRRAHPMGVFSLGVSLSKAIELAGPAEPLSLRLRWRRELTVDTEFYVEGKNAEGSRYAIEIRDHNADLLVASDVELKPAK
ncbi:MAG: hypothetical protein ABJC09_04860 [Terriglobia bacterium]